MHRHLITSAVIAASAASALGACGGSAGPTDGATSSVARRDAAAPITIARTPARSGEVLVRGEASPADTGPYALAGRYRVRFEQVAPEDPSLDFSTQTAFAAHLEQPRAGGPGRTIPLVKRAARSGATTVNVPRGRWRLVVDFGDFPYAVRLTPEPR